MKCKYRKSCRMEKEEEKLSHSIATIQMCKVYIHTVSKCGMYV